MHYLPDEVMVVGVPDAQMLAMINMRYLKTKI
jgi:hypothetical protein